MIDAKKEHAVDATEVTLSEQLKVSEQRKRRRSDFIASGR